MKFTVGVAIASTRVHRLRGRMQSVPTVYYLSDNSSPCYTRLKIESNVTKGFQEVMEDYFCPRCKFRLLAVKKHICLTCGYKLPITNHTAETVVPDRGAEAGRSASMPRLWSKVFKWEFDSGDNESIESTQEKPALS